MNIHYILHAPFEKLGIIEDWALEREHAMNGTQPYAGEKLPRVEEFDVLIVMGGPQSVGDLDAYPYLKDEINLISEALQENKIIIGVCLGAQLISEALGAPTEKSPQKEIGMFFVELTQEGKLDSVFKDFPRQFNVMHWHGDMPGVPEGAAVLAQSKGCPRQIIRYNDRVYGFQCHLELTKKSVEDLIGHCPEDLAPGTYIQPAREMLSSDFNSVNHHMKNILDRIVQKAS